MHHASMNLLTVAQVAERLHIGESAVRARLRRREIPGGINIAPARTSATAAQWRVDEDIFDAWLKQLQEGTA